MIFSKGFIDYLKQNVDGIWIKDKSGEINAVPEIRTFQRK